MSKPKSDARPVEPLLVIPDGADEATVDKVLADHKAAVQKYWDDVDAWEKSRPVLSITEVREVNDLKQGPLYIPEWDGCVITRSLTRDEAVNLDKECRQDGVLQSELYTRRLIQVGTVEPAIAPDEPIHKKHPVALRRIADDVLLKSGMLQEVAADLADQFQE